MKNKFSWIFLIMALISLVSVNASLNTTLTGFSFNMTNMTGNLINDILYNQSHFFLLDNNEGYIGMYNGSGSYISQFNYTPTMVAPISVVWNSSSLFIADMSSYATSRFYEYDTSLNFTGFYFKLTNGSRSGSGFSAAVSNVSSFLLINYSATNTWFLELDKEEHLISKFETTPYIGAGAVVKGLTWNGSNFFVASENKVFIFDTVGNNINNFSNPISTAITGITYNTNTKSFYVSNRTTIWEFNLSDCLHVLTNTSWSEYTIISDCYLNNTKTKQRTLTQYDAVYCEDYSNITFTDYSYDSCYYATETSVNGILGLGIYIPIIGIIIVMVLIIGLVAGAMYFREDLEMHFGEIGKTLVYIFLIFLFVAVMFYVVSTIKFVT